MDKMIKEIIKCFDLKYLIIRGIDYDFQVYVDDIFLELKSEKASIQIKSLFETIQQIFAKSNYKINVLKTIGSGNNGSILNIGLIFGDKKYLGIYFEKDEKRYIKLFDLELKIKYPKNHLLHTLQSINQNLELINKNAPNILLSIKLKFNYRFTVFAKNNLHRHLFLKLHGYQNLAQYWYS